MSTTKQRIFYLDFLRVFAIFNIIGNHAINRAFHNYVFQEVDYAAMTMPGTVLKAFITVFSRLGVFLFLMISGKLILNKDFTKEHALNRFLKHNYLGLFITTEMWLFIMFWELQFLGSEPFTLSALPGAIGSMFSTMLFTNQVTLNTMWYMNMLLVMYLVLPIFALAIRKLSPRVFLLPLGILFISSVLVPTANDLLYVIGSKRELDFALQPVYLFSIYALYVFLGYFLDKGLLEKVPGWVFGVCFVLVMGGMTAFQVYGYSLPINYIFNNKNLGFFLLAICLYELGRRYAYHFERFRKPVTYLSSITFAIYLLHLCIMHAMHYWMADLGLNQWLYFVILYVGSIAISIGLIALGTKSKFIKRYFFLIR